MAFVNITKPVNGDPTRTQLASDIIDNLNDLNARTTTGDKPAIQNGSFEYDSDSNGVPDSWTRTLYTSGSAAYTGASLADTNCVHGQRAYKFTSPGGSGNGGGDLETTNFFEVTPNRSLVFSYQFFATASTLAVKLQVTWYTAAQSSISTSTLISESSGLPSIWETRYAITTPPSTARYAKLKLIGGDTTSTTAGSVYFDNVTVDILEFTRRVEFFHDYGTVTNNYTHTWVSPITGLARIWVWGGGGGGGGGTSGDTGAGGGGSGEMAMRIYPVTAGTAYTITIGRGGAAGTSGNGTSGGQTAFITTGTLSANGGAGGTGWTTGNAAGGAGGSGGVGHYVVSGNAGQTATTNNGGWGACSLWGFNGGVGGTSGNGSAPRQLARGAGGGGRYRSGGTQGGDGDPGACMIEY